MGREALRFVCAEQSVRDEDGAFTDRRICDQVGIDLHGDVESNMLGVGQHEVAEIASIGRHGGDGLGLSFDGRMREDFVRRVQDGVLCVGEQSLTACAKKPRNHRTHLLASSQVLQDQKLGFELLEPRKIELGGLRIHGPLPRTRELEPDASLDGYRLPLPSRLGVLPSSDRLHEPISFDRIAVRGRAEQKPRRSVQTAQPDVELCTTASSRMIREAGSRALRAHFVHLSRGLRGRQCSRPETAARPR